MAGEVDFSAQLLALQKQVNKTEDAGNRVTIVVFSADMDRAMSAFIIATGAAAMGMQVDMYFTFWGLACLKKKTLYRKKSLPEKMVSLLFPSGPKKFGTSKLNMLGAGPRFFRYLMKKKNVSMLEELISTAQELGVTLTACQMSMGMLGLTKDELLDGLDYAGVAAYLEKAAEARINHFI